ncbi:WD40 repeat-like protein [Rickenella mellea]|uniref:WD40 repeat-like protein n=1 Tax=Rickenella mellea TaxID=50990 RepID=A0A4Y7QLN6_9AGAM|nr:WD40 repeat-like protein [Rickenella mellea]
MGISGFGKTSKKKQLDDNRFDKTKRDTQSTTEPEFDPNDEEQPPIFPVTHELVMKDHLKVVSALALDPSGARVLSGSHDYDCKLWDFGGMGATIHDLKYSNDGSQFLVISGTTQAKLFDRDGEETATFVKGDPYIRDMKHTAGHVGELTAGAWHPKDPQLFMTSSADSTVRIWDVENKRKQKTVIVVKSKERGTRTKVTACAYSPDGSYITAACLDGALHVWKTNSNFVRPDQTMEGAHGKGSETGSVGFSIDGRTLLTRSGDDTVKLWDLRSFRKPIATRTNITTLYPTTNASWSPDEKFVLTGSGSTLKGGKGKLLLLRRGDLEVEKELEMESTPVRVVWHPKINQIVTGLANGQISVLYSPMTSLNGAKLLMNKGPARKPDIESMAAAELTPQILTPHALPMFRDGDERSGKRKREKDRMDPRKSRRPELPITGPGKGGRVGASATQHVVQNLFRDTTRDQDPREALLKYAEVAESDPQWTGDAVKVDIDYLSQESDARHEPIAVNLDKIDAASTRPTRGSPVDPEDVEMAERPSQTDSAHKLADIPMEDAFQNGHTTNGHTPTVENLSIETPTGQSPAPELADENTTAANAVASTSRIPDTNGSVPDDSDQPPPAKRARKLSDAEQASRAHSASPPITTAINGAYRPSTLSQNQWRFCNSTIRTLKKLKDAAPFLLPVDPVALNIPHYPSIIKHPMDFSTIDRKLASSNVAKPDPNPNNPRYCNADEFITDVRLIFSNCLTFNGPEHLVTQMGKRVESVFDKQIKNMPPPAEEKASTPPPPPPPAAAAPAKKPQARRSSTSVPTIRRSETETARPKREIHPPPPKDLPYVDPPKKTRRAGKKMNDGTIEQLKYCGKILADLQKKQYWNIASPFYEPVDWVKLDIPSYPKLIKKPMDLGTMKKKLDNKEYPNAQKFHDDFKLLIKNCTTFNPHGTPVNQAGLELQRVFNEKWAALPPLREVSDDEDDEEEEESDDDQSRTIAMMESQIETMRSSISALKQKKVKKEKKEKKRDKYTSQPSSSKSNGKPSKGSSSKKKGKKPIADSDVLSFDQKKDLSETIQTLDGAKLEKVISIIHEGVPEIRDSTEEIELDIDSLPAMVLTKLYNYVLRPLRPPTTKRNRTGTGTGTGGLKRKSMDEDVEAEKIRQLEERMRLFEGGSGAAAPARAEDYSVHSSDDSSSDSSGSDSE